MAVGMVSYGMIGLLLGAFGSSGAFMGLPPGERDAAYLKAAPVDSLLYVEWSSRGTGIEGDKGIDGLVADPEMKLFLTQLRSAILDLIERESDGVSVSSAEKLMGEHLPPLIESLLMNSGCVYLQYEPPKTIEPEEGDPSGGTLGMIAAVNFTAIVDLGENADQMEKHLIALLEPLAEDFGIEPPQDGLNMVPIPVPIPGIPVKLHREGNHLILGVGKTSIPRAISGLKGEVEGLGSSEVFQKYYNQVKMDRVGMVSWIDVAQTREAVFTLIPAPIKEIATSIMSSLGVQSLDAIVNASGVIDGQIATRSYVQTGPGSDGLLSLVSGRSLTAGDYKQVPADSDFVASLTVDAEGIFTAIETVVENVDPSLSQNVASMKEMFSRQMGFSLETDLPEAFGQQWTIYNSKSAGGVFFSAIALSVEVKDKEKAKKIVDRLLGMLEGILPGVREGEYRTRGVELKRGTFLDHQIAYINTVGDDDVPIAPAICLTENHLLIGLHPQTIKAQLRFAASDEKSLAESLEGVLPAEGNVICYGEFDAPQLVRYIYAIVPYVAQIALSEGQSDGFAMDIFSVPSARSILPYMKKSRSWIVRTEQGILAESRSSLPLSPVVGILPAISVVGRNANSTFDKVAPRIEAIEAVPEEANEFGQLDAPPVLVP